MGNRHPYPDRADRAAVAQLKRWGDRLTDEQDSAQANHFSINPINSRRPHSINPNKGPRIDQTDGPSKLSWD